LVHPERPWLARTFLNFVPLLVDPRSAANCFVVSVPPSLHDHDLGVTLVAKQEGKSADVLPLPVLEAVVHSWIVLEAWSLQNGLTAVPFINGGKSRASGQSLDHFHGQLYALGPSDEPPLYRRLANLRRTACPVCDILGDEGLRVRTFGSVAVAVHPAPSRNLTLVVAPLEERTHLAELEVADFAAALSWAVRRYETLLGGVPAYVVAVRAGDLVGHLHAEVVPRSNVNIPGGFEETTGLAVSTQDPRAVARSLQES
jgi:galactose-1-phosphate uridylyltransferase